MPLILLVFLFFSSPPSYSQTDVALKSISQSKTWIYLIGFKDSNVSSITSKNFFINKAGNKNPFLELKSTLKEFRKDFGDDPDEHAICKYSGRYSYLSQIDALKLDKNKLFKCEQFIRFSGIDDFKNTFNPSIIFATGFLGNPASYFGHLLVKLDSGLNKPMSNFLDDVTVSYGARVPDDENMVLYVIKGLVGSYNSLYTQKEFYYHLHHYSDGEFRDLWEYELSLNAAAYFLLAGHLWEMIGVEHKYFFTNRNCAYRIAELIELVSDDSLITSSNLFVSPQLVMQALDEAKNNNKKLVSSVSYIPSRQSKLYSKFRQLNSEEKLALKSVILDQEINLGRYDFTDLNRVRVIDTVFDYYSTVYDGNEISTYEPYVQALNYRLELPSSIPDFESISRESKFKHKPSYLQFKYKSNNISNDASIIRFRPVYYDQLDSGFGHIKGSSLSMLDTSISFIKGKPEIEHIDFIKIENLYAFKTGLPGDDKLPWALQLGVTKINNDCEDCLAFSAYAGKGYAWSFFKDNIFFNAMLNFGALGEDFDDDILYAELKLGFNIFTFNNLRILYEPSYKQFFNTGNHQRIDNLQIRYAINQSYDLRLTAVSDKTDTIAFGLGYYF